MSNNNFHQQFAAEISALWRSAEPHYNIGETDFAARVEMISARSVSSGDNEEIKELFTQLKASDLCLALACEKGDDRAWRDFETTHRTMMIGAARALTKEQTAAEDLTQTVYGELFGVRESGQTRPSKFVHYSGRGSLGGWLRAVVYQTFIDRTRQNSRYEQIAEADEFERLANNADSKISAAIARPDEAYEKNGNERLHRATTKAMTQALQSLEPRERLLLNYYYFDELTLKEIGAVLNVHEATASRWLSKAQQNVRKKTEEFLRQQGLGKTEINECFVLAARTEIDVRQIITEAKGAATERAP